MARVRFPVVLFDLDGTLIDSGPMIVASMKHAAKSVLGREIPEEVLSAAVGGPGLVAQMHALAPDRVDDLVAAYREHNEPLHEELEAFWEVLEVLPRLRERAAASASSRPSGTPPCGSRSTGCPSWRRTSTS